MLIKDYYIIKRLFILLIETVWTVRTNIIIQTLKMFINCFRINFIISRKVLTKGEQYIKRQSLLEVVYRRYLSEAVDRYKLIKEKL